MQFVSQAFVLSPDLLSDYRTTALLSRTLKVVRASCPVQGWCPVSGRYSTANFIDLDQTYSVNFELPEKSQLPSKLGYWKIIRTDNGFGLTKKPASGH